MELFSTLESTIIPNVILVTVLIAHNVPEFVRERGSRRVSWRPSLKWRLYLIFFKGYHVSHCSGPKTLLMYNI